MNSMVDNKLTKWREEHLKSKAKSCQLRREVRKVEHRFKNLFRNPHEVTDKPLKKN